MPITPILPVTLDALRAIALGDGFREGRILEARVTAVLSNTLARIEIDGQPLLVTMTKPLPVGVALTLKVERDAGQLKLIAQGPARDMPEAPLRIDTPTPPRTTGIPADPVKAALAKIQTMTVESMLDDNPAAEVALHKVWRRRLALKPCRHRILRPAYPSRTIARLPQRSAHPARTRPTPTTAARFGLKRPSFVRFTSRPMR